MMKDIHGNPLPASRRSAPPVQAAEPTPHGIEQRHWIKFFVVGLFLSSFGSLEFMAGRPEVSNVFNDPVYASYWVFTGILVIFAALVVRTWGTR
jgi:hypothetical protein